VKLQHSDGAIALSNIAETSGGGAPHAAEAATVAPATPDGIAYGGAET
jgi:hypothetical protein